MKKTWKWIIGIVIGLLILALLFGTGFAYRIRSMTYRTQDLCGVNGFNTMPFETMRGHSAMMPLGGIFGGLIWLGVLTLIVLGIIALVRSLRKPVFIPPSPAPSLSCPKCQQPVQQGWVACPHCGKKI